MAEQAETTTSTMSDPREGSRVTLREWATILGAAFAIRFLVAFVLLGKMQMVSEGEVYSTFAIRLYEDFPGTGAYYLPPLTSTILAGAYQIFGITVTVARIVSIAESVAMVAVMAGLARELTKDERVVRIATWMAALYAPSILLSGQPYTQHLASLFVAAVALFAIRALRTGDIRTYALTGIVLGFGCLTRPSMASLLVVLLGACAVLFWRARERKAKVALVGSAAALFVCTIAPVAPVLVHNHEYGAGYTISTNNDRNFFLGNNKYTPNYKTSHFGQRDPEQLEPEIRDYLLELYDRPDNRAAMRQEAIDFIVHHPFITAYRTLNRATSFWGFDYVASRIIQDDMGFSTKKALPMLALEAGSYVALMVLVIAALFARAGAERDPFALRVLLVLTLGYELPYILAFSGGTFHFPIVGLLFPIGALAVVQGVRPMVTALFKSRTALVALAVLGAIQVQYAYYSLAMSG